MNRRFFVHIAARCDRGCVRTNNEDNLYLNGTSPTQSDLETSFSYEAEARSEASLYAVCDGMGGEEYGEEAASIAVAELKTHQRLIFAKKSQISDRINTYINSANSQICEAIRKKEKRMGSTLALVAFSRGTVFVVNLGDSRIYLMRDGTLSQLSVDHTQVQMMVRAGILTQNEAKTHPHRNKLTQHLGIFEEELILEPAISTIPIRLNDTLLLCSDGLTDMLDDEDIRTVLAHSNSPSFACKELMESALRNGGHDNISIVLLTIRQHKNAFRIPLWDLIIGNRKAGVGDGK